MNDNDYNKTVEELKRKGLSPDEAVRVAQAMRNQQGAQQGGGGPGAGVRQQRSAEDSALAVEGKQTLAMGGGGGLKSMLPMLMMGMLLGAGAGAKTTPDAGGQDYEGMVRAEATRQGVDPNWAASVARNESNFNPNAKSPVGAAGIMQLMPGTAKDMGVSDPFDPVQNIAGGVKYLGLLDKKYGGDKRNATMAYNWGMGNVDKGGTPPQETLRYTDAVLGGVSPQKAAAPVEQGGGSLESLNPLFGVKSAAPAAPQTAETATNPLVPSNMPDNAAAAARADKNAASTASNAGAAAASGAMMAGPWGAVALGGAQLASDLLGGDNGAEEAAKNQERLQKQERLLGGISGVRDWAQGKNAETRRMLLALGGLM